MLDSITNNAIAVKPEDVFKKAADHGLYVQSIDEFRELGHHYDRIEDIMDEYRSSQTTWSAMGGLTTGIGGFATSITFAGLDTISLSIQLYRLSQRFAILNGFDSNNPLQHENVVNIYFEALGINAVTQATLKQQLLKAGAIAGTERGSENMVLKLIIRIGKAFGKKISSRQAGRLVPVIGGIAGASVNYSFAHKTSKAMKKAYKQAFFKKWY